MIVSLLLMRTCLSCWGSWQSSFGCGSHCLCTQRDPGCGQCSSECSLAAASHSWSLALPWPAPGLQCTSRPCQDTGGARNKESVVAFATDLFCLCMKGTSAAQQHDQGTCTNAHEEWAVNHRRCQWWLDIWSWCRWCIMHEARLLDSSLLRFWALHLFHT